MKILLCGYFNIGSAGDEAALRFLRDQIPDADITVMTRSPSEAYANQSRVSVHEKLEHRTKEEAEGRNLNGFNPGDDRLRLAGILDLLASADLLLLGPGAIFNSYNSDMYRGVMQEMYAMSQLAKMVRCPCGLWSVSASMLTYRHLTGQAQAMIDGARFVIFRDRVSWPILKACGVGQPSKAAIHELPDAVLGFASTQACPAPADHGRLVVSAKDVFPGIKGDYRKRLREIVKIWLLANPVNTVDFVAQYTGHSPNDIEEAFAISEGLPRVRVLASKDPSVTLGFYRGAGRVIATRLHAAVFAVMAGIPQIAAIDYDPKVSGFIEMLDESFDANNPCLPGPLTWFRGYTLAHLLPKLDRYREIITEAIG